MKEELDKIIFEINSHTSWSKNAKIRYAYIKLGELVSKDAMFFYTIQNNLLSEDKEDIRYSTDRIKSIMNTQDLFDYKVMCKNSAEMLKYILNGCSIESEIRKTLVYTYYEDITINHYFVVVTGDEDKKYFLTLNPDLPNIKIGKRTSKFAYEIRYHIEDDYFEGKNDGKQYYEGEEVKYSVLSDEEIKKLDKQIGYIPNIIDDKNDKDKQVYTDYFFDILKEMYKNNSDYIDYVSHKTHFYETISRLLNQNKRLSEVLFEKPNLNREKTYYLDFKMANINNSTWDDLKIFVLNSLVSRLSKEYNINSDVDYISLLKDKNYDEIRRVLNTSLYSKTDKERINKLGSLNPFYTVKKMVELFKIIDMFKDNKNTHFKDFNHYKAKFSQCLSYISLAFVEKSILPNEGSLSSTYLTNKLIYAFESIFDVGNINTFNNIGLAEQVAIIKELLEIVLSDIKKDDDLPNYDDKKSPLRNRIISTVIFDKESKKPCYLIYVKNTSYGDNANMLIVYDLENNKLYLDKSPIDIISDYYVIKDADMKLIIEEFNSSKEDEEVNFNYKTLE